MGEMSWQAHRAIEYGREVIGQTRDDLAEALTAETGEEWSYQMVAKLENGRKTFTVDLLQAVANVQGLPYEWYLVDPRSKLSVFRGLNEANPGYDNSDPIATGESADNLNPDYAHAPGEVCFVCVDNPNGHVRPEDMIPGGGPQIPGQFVIDLRDEALEKFLEGAA